MIEIRHDNIEDGAVVNLLREHLADMYANSPPESVHALDVDSLKHHSVTFWVAREGDAVLGCAALKELDPGHGELKSMRTSSASRNRGVGSRLYAKYGFEYCGPFADYTLDPNSKFMTREI